MLGEDGFGVELDAVDGQFAVGEAHDFAFGGFGGDFEAGGEGFAFDDEGVVAGGLEGAGEAGEDILAGVKDGRGFAVHEARGADDFAAVDLADALVAEADSENGNFPSEFPDRVATDAGFGRGAGTGGDDDFFWCEFCNVGQGDLVVALHEQVGAEFAEILDEVVGKGIVVIDDEYHGN